MSEDRELINFVRHIHAEVQDRATGGAPSDESTDFKENVFTDLVLEHLAEVGATENPNTCHFYKRLGRATGKVNGYSVSDDETTVDLFVSIYMDAQDTRTVPRDDIARAATRAVSFLRACLRGIHDELEVASDEYAMASRIHDLRAKIEKTRIFILTDGISRLEELEQQVLGEIPISFEVWTIQRLYRSMLADLPREDIEVDFEELLGEPLPCLTVRDIDPVYSAYLAILPATLLVSLYEEYGARLLEFNVRSFLQARGKVNRGIRDTLREEPSRFLAYNNGISITADEVESIRSENGHVALKKARGFQIVNGGQTTASIHRSNREHEGDVSRVFVPAKITVVDGDYLETFVPKISKYANTQNVVQMADFSANDAYHVAIERLSRTIWCPGEQGRWFYERARGQYQDASGREATTPGRRKRFLQRTPNARKFTKTDLAKFLNCWDQLPHVVSRGGQKNFVLFMQDLRTHRGQGWEPDETYYRELVAKAIVFRACERIVRQEQFAGYRANIVSYLVAHLSLRSAGQFDMDFVWRNQQLSATLGELLRGWSHQVNDAILRTAAGRNITEWCKKEDCWKAVQSLDLPLPDPLPPELLGIGSPQTRRDPWLGAMTPREYDSISECKSIDGATWLHICAWGTETGLLDAKQRGIASTLGGLAAQGWPKDPSRKQAWHAIRILGLAREHKMLGSNSLDEVGSDS